MSSSSLLKNTKTWMEKSPNTLAEEETGFKLEKSKSLDHRPNQDLNGSDESIELDTEEQE